MGHGVSTLASSGHQQQNEQLPVAEVAYEGMSLIKKVSQVFHYVCKGGSASFDEFCLGEVSMPFFIEMAEKFLAAIAIISNSQRRILAHSRVNDLVDIIGLHVKKYPNIYGLANGPEFVIAKGCRYNKYSFFSSIFHFKLLIHDHYQNFGDIFNINDKLETANLLLPMLDFNADLYAGMLSNESNYSRLKAYLTTFDLICPENNWRALGCNFPQIINNLFYILKASQLPLQIFFTTLSIQKARFNVCSIIKLHELSVESDEDVEHMFIAEVIQTYLIKSFIKWNPAVGAVAVFLARSSIAVTEDTLKTFLLKLEGMAANKLALPKLFKRLRKEHCEKVIIKVCLVEYGFLDRMEQSLLDLCNSSLFKILRPLLQKDEVIGLKGGSNFFKVSSPDPSPASPKAQSRLQQSGRLSSLSTSAIRLHFNDPKATAPERDNHVRTSPSTNGL